MIERFKINIALLALAQAMYFTASIGMISFGGLVGQMLSNDPMYATLPVALMVVGTTITTFPASYLMKRVGRKAGFILGASMGALSGALAAYAIFEANFVLFAAAAMMLGSYQAFAQYYRFAAVETAPSDYTSRAVSFVLVGGVIAAVSGPYMARISKDWFEPVTFAGSFIAISIVSVMALVPLLALKMPAKVSDEESHGAERPLREIVRQPVFIAASLNSCTSYGLMVLVMTATPLAMVACSFTPEIASQVIQWHVLGMFVPSFFTGILIKRFGLLPILFLGMALFAASAIAAVSGVELDNFTIALILLGVAWNFLYVGGSSLLTQAYTPAEKAKTQALNEFLINIVAATASFSSGGLLAFSGWEAVNLGAFPLLALTFLATVWHALSRKRAMA